MTLDAERNRRKRPRRWLTVSSIVGLLLAAGAWIGVKQVAQQRLTQRIADATGLKVEASHIRIGPRGVSARNVIVGDATNPTLTADQLTIIASFGELMSREPTIESIRFDSPTLRLTANERGELDWPFRGRGESSLPGQRVVLVDAKVDVEQPGRAPLVVEGIDLAIEQASHRGFDFDGTIQSFFGSQWQVSGSGKVGGEAQARLTTAKLELDSREVTALALVPTASNRLPLAVSGAVRIDLLVSASQQTGVLRSSMRLTDATLSFPTIDMQLTATDASLRIDNDGIDLLELTASVGKGSLKGDASLSFGDPAANGGFRMKLDGIDLASLRSALPLAADVDGVTTGEITGRFRVDHAGSLQLDVQGLGTVSDARVGRIQMASVQAEFGIKDFMLSSSGEKRISGELTLTELEIREIAIADVTNAIQMDTSNKSFTVGSVSGIGSLQVPLETAYDIRTWSAVANLSTSNISALGFHASNGEASFTMAGGLLLLDELAAQLGNHASISGSIQWPLASDRPAVIDLHGQVSAGQLITAFNTHTDVSDLSGDLLVAAKLQLPSNAIGTIEALSGSLSVSSRELSWKGMGADELTFNGRFSESTLWLEDAKLRLSDNGEVIAKGRIGLSDNGVSNVDVRGTRLDVRAIVDIVGQINPDFGATLRTTRVADAVKRTLADLPGVASAKGQLSFDGTVRSSREDLMNPIDWIVTTEFRTNIASLAGMQTEGVSGRIELSDRTLALSDVNVRLPDSGHIGLVASIPLRSDRTDDSRVRVEWHLVPLAEFAKYMSREVDIVGTTSGEFVVTAPAGTTPELQQLSGKGTTTIQAAEVFSRVRIGDAASEIALKAGRLSFSDIALAGRTNAVGHAAIDLFATHAYDFSVKIDNEPITVPITGSTSENSKPTLTGRLSLHADANGDLAESRLRLRGDAELQQIRFNHTGISDVKVAFANVDHRNDRLQLEGDLLGGTVRMIADLPNSAAPEKLITVDVQDWSLDEITALANLSNLHVELSGRLNGRGTIASWDNPSTRNVGVRLSGASGKYADIPIDDLVLEMQMRAKRSTLKLTGKVLEGELIVEGATTLGDELPIAIPIDVHLHAARLERVGKASARYAKLQPLSGLGDLDMEVTLEVPGFRIAGAGDVSLRDVQWNRRRVLPAAKSKISVNDRFVRFQNLSVSLARGTIRGSVDWPRSRLDAGEYDVSIRDVELSQLAEFLPRWMPRATGTIEARLTGRASDYLTGRGDVRVNRLTMQGLEATAIQLPFSYSLHTDNLSGKMVLRRATGRVANGRISSDGTIEFGRRKTIDLHANISKIDVGRLSASVLGRGRYGLGRLSGTLDLTGNGIRSVRDLDGRFRGTLENSQLMRLSVFSDLVAFANVGTVGRGEFDSDQIELRLNNSVISTPGLVLKSDQAELFLRGQAYLNQRLDLDAALQTGNIVPDFGLGELTRSPLANLAVPGASIVTQSLDFLSNRVIYLHVGGTVRSPNFQLRTDRILQDALLRYYLPVTRYQQIQRIR